MSNHTQPYSVKELPQAADRFIKPRIKEDNEAAQRINSLQNAYFYVGMPCDMSRYHKVPNGMTYKEFSKDILPLKPSSNLMTFAAFKMISYTPMRIEGGFFTAPKIVPPQLKVETLNEPKRIIDAYTPYTIPATRNTPERLGIRLSDEVKKEMNKNFVHPRLTTENATRFSEHYTISDDISGSKYITLGINEKNIIAQRYKEWKDGRESLKKHFDWAFQRLDQRLAQEKAQAKEKQTKQNRAVDEFDRDFGIK